MNFYRSIRYGNVRNGSIRFFIVSECHRAAFGFGDGARSRKYVAALVLNIRVAAGGKSYLAAPVAFESGFVFLYYYFLSVRNIYDTRIINIEFGVSPHAYFFRQFILVPIVFVNLYAVEIAHEIPFGESHEPFVYPTHNRSFVCENYVALRIIGVYFIVAFGFCAVAVIEIHALKINLRHDIVVVACRGGFYFVGYIGKLIQIAQNCHVVSAQNIGISHAENGFAFVFFGFGTVFIEFGKIYIRQEIIPIVINLPLG